MNKIFSSLLCLVCFAVAGNPVEQNKREDSKNRFVQGWNILSSDEKLAEMVIERSKEYAINHLQLSHHLIMDLRQAKDPVRAARVNRLVDRAHEAKIPKVLVWDHMLYHLNYYPKKFRTGPDSLINLDNPEFWTWIKDDYREMLDLVPQIDGLILTFIETGARIENQYSEILKTPQEKLAAMIDTISSLIIDEKGLELYVRTFFYNREERKNMINCLNLIQNEGIRVMTKEVPHDFFLTHPVASHIKKIKFPVIIEFDAAHEYNGQGIIAGIFPELHLKRWEYYKKLPNVIGYVARTDRFHNTTILNHNPAEINLAVLHEAFDNEVDIDSVYHRFVTKKYGKAAVPFIVPAMKKGYPIVNAVFYTLGLNTNSHSRLQYADNSAYQRHVSGKWMDNPVITIENGVNKEFHYWRDVVNHLAPAWYKKDEGTQLAKESKWVLEQGWLQPEEMMNEEYLRYVLTEKKFGTEQASQALQLVRQAESYVTGTNSYDSLLHIFERTLLTARLYEAAAKVFFGYRVYARGDRFQTEFVTNALSEGLTDLKEVAHEMYKYPYKGPVGQFEWEEDIYRGLAYYNAIQNRQSDQFTPNTFPYFPYRGIPPEAREEIKTTPNIIFIMVDDMGYGDLGCYGQKEIKTPHIDQLAREGIRFTNFYSGSPVCAPARSVLMTGRHTGHTTVRGNFGKGGVTGLGGGEGRVPLKNEDITIAEILKNAGYATGMTGKWGLGEPGTSGLPNDQGFDEWLGFLNQRRAHNHYADYIWHNKNKYPIPENANGQEGKYTHELFTGFALDFIDRHAKNEQPFFLYIPYLLPHDAFQIPEINPLYADKAWSDQEKIYASMISRIDTDLGKIKTSLKKNNVLNNTLLVFTSDNGAANRYEGRFDSSGKLRGKKRDVYEGGMRVPFIVSMPGTVPQNEMNHTVGCFADILPTFTEMTNQPIPENVDGISLKEVFLNNKQLEDERILYWEFHEMGGKQAVRKGNWKGLRLNVHKNGFHNNIELYNLNTDPSETNNVASQFPGIVEKIKRIMLQEHEFSETFPFDFELENN